MLRHALSLLAVSLVLVAPGCRTLAQSPQAPKDQAPGATQAPGTSGQKEDAWKPLRFLVGTWEGEGTGKPGRSTVQREYKFVLGNRFLEARNISTYEPQPANPKGERHEDLGFFSRDRGQKKFVFRQFHIEGFVNTYVGEVTQAEPLILTFTSTHIENIPAGWRARETYKVLGPDELIEVFELAAPGKEFEVYSETRLRRKHVAPQGRENGG